MDITAPESQLIRNAKEIPTDKSGEKMFLAHGPDFLSNECVKIAQCKERITLVSKSRLSIPRRWFGGNQSRSYRKTTI